MDKSNYFSGKSVFGQLISLTEYKTIKEEVKMCDSDKAFKNFTDHRIGFVTRIKNNADYKETEALEVEEFIHSGVLQDDIIEIVVKEKRNDKR